MKKFLVALLTVTAITGIFVGCSSAKNEAENKANQEENMAKTKYDEEVQNYSGLLDSGKTYEEMTVEERKMFVSITEGFDNFTQEFKDKYREIVDKIKVTKDEAIEKWNSEKEEKEDDKIDLTMERENIIGVSDRDFTQIDSKAPANVPNDKTGNWRIIKISTPEDIIYYAKSYAEKNIQGDKELHGIVNTENNTTTAISKLSNNILNVTVHKYLENEESDANKLFGGEVINEYWVYMDNGEIEKIE